MLWQPSLGWIRKRKLRRRSKSISLNTLKQKKKSLMLNGFVESIK